VIDPQKKPISNNLFSWINAFLLLFVLIVFCNRWQTVFTRGVIYFDEASYLLEAQGLHQAFNAFPSVLRGKLPVDSIKQNMRAEGSMFPPTTAKPTFSSLLAIGTYLPIKRDAVGNLLSLVMATLTTIIFWKSALALGCDNHSAFIASCLFFLSPVYGYYSVSSFSQCTAAFFFQLAILLHLRRHDYLSSFCIGVALTSHYGFLMGCAALLLWNIVDIAQKKEPIGQKARTILKMGLSFVLPLLFFAIIYQAGKWCLQGHLGDMHYETYPEQFHRQVRGNAIGWPSWMASWHKNLVLFTALARSEGIGMAAMLLISSAELIFRWRQLHREQRGMYLLAIGMVLFWLIQPGVAVSRIAVFLWPSLFLLFAMTLTKWKSKISSVFLILIVMGIAVESSYISFAMNRRLRSSHIEVAEYLNGMNYHGPIVDPNTILLSQFYAHRQMYHQERVKNFDTFQEQVLPLFEYSNQKGEIPVLLFDRLWDKSGDPRLIRFFEHLTAHGAARTWPLPYSDLDLYHFDNSDSQHLKYPSDFLSLYWAKRSDFNESP